MRRSLRLLIVAVVLVSGLALFPYVGLPSARFSWQQFVMVYGERPPTEIYLPIIVWNSPVNSSQ